MRLIRTDDIGTLNNLTMEQLNNCTIHAFSHLYITIKADIEN